MIEKDERFTLAERYVEETGVSVFLTGKAGTGKTTFLKEIVRQTSKRFAVVAPTGAGGHQAVSLRLRSGLRLHVRLRFRTLRPVQEIASEYNRVSIRGQKGGFCTRMQDKQRSGDSFMELPPLAFTKTIPIRNSEPTCCLESSRKWP